MAAYAGILNDVIYAIREAVDNPGPNPWGLVAVLAHGAHQASGCEMSEPADVKKARRHLVREISNAMYRTCGQRREMIQTRREIYAELAQAITRLMHPSDAELLSTPSDGSSLDEFAREEDESDEDDEEDESDEDDEEDESDEDDEDDEENKDND